MKTKSFITRIPAFSMVLTMCFSLLGTPAVVNAATINDARSGKPVKAHTISASNNTTVYNTATAAYKQDTSEKKGTMYASDEGTINNIQTVSGVLIAKVTYNLDAGGTKTGYVRLAVFTSASDLGKKATAKTKITTYRRPGSSAAAGYISAGDPVFRLAEKSDYIQVFYNSGSVSNPTGYRIAWITKAAANTLFGSTSAVTYATYNGVSYASASAVRRKALDCAWKMCGITWLCQAPFPSWRGSNGGLNKVYPVGSTTADTYYREGKKYMGIPYSMNNHTYTASKWAAMVPTITTANMSADYYGNGAGTAKGMDCSYFVYTALKASGVADDLSYMTTAAMVSNTKVYVPIKWSELKPGDVLVKSGHCMMYVGTTRAGKIAVMEASATAGSHCQYSTYSKDSLSSYSCRRYAGF